MKTIDQITMIQMAVSDMDKSKVFYTDKLGFTATGDNGGGNQRWVSLALPGGGTSINLTTAFENLKPGSMKMYLSSPDLEATYKTLTAKGVKPAGEIKNDPWGKWFEVDDPDGNRWLIVQS
jgi:catechol 2,3-dioxygenase-like lactoylglutathione lyase family enzyme